MKKILAVALLLALAIIAGTAVASDTQTVGVSAAVVGTCKFNSGGTMAFGNLDPALTADVNATVTQPAFWCTTNSSYTLTDDDGLYEVTAGSQSVKHASSNNYIAYTFTYTATGTGNGKNNPITMNVAGTITNANYVDKPEGNYADTVTLTINP